MQDSDSSCLQVQLKKNMCLFMAGEKCVKGKLKSFARSLNKPKGFNIQCMNESLWNKGNEKREMLKISRKIKKSR